MKRVKFNATSGFNNIPEDQYADYCAEFSTMKKKDYKNYKERLSAGSDFEFVAVEIGQTVDVPNWYYEAHKNSMASIGVSFDKYKTKAGQRRPYMMAEALMHGDVKDEKTMTQVKLFDLIEDLDVVVIPEEQLESKRIGKRL